MRLMLMLAGVAVLGACAGKKPAAAVTAVRVGERSESGVVLLVDVLARNPNDRQVPLRITECAVSVAGSEGNADRFAECFVPAYGSHVFTIPVAVTNPTPGRADVWVRGKVEYVGPTAIAQTLYNNRLRRTSAAFEGGFEADIP